MKSQTEIELKFLVPPAARPAVLAELARGSATLERTTLSSLYLDTSDRRLARAGIAWRVRRDGHRWTQTLKGTGSNALARFEHEVIRPDANPDAAEHAGTPLGDRLIALLHRARADGVELVEHFHAEVRRTARRVRTHGAVVEVAFDEGRLMAAGSAQRIHEVEFELVSGSTAAMLALAERWRKRFGLIFEPRGKAERGDRLAQGLPSPPLRKAAQPSYPKEATAAEAFGSVLDECLAQITHNAVGLVEGDPALRVEHVHQLRVGIRRLRSALRAFQGWAPPPPPDLVDGLRALFATLGLSRDSDVLDSGVAAELAQAGAPPLTQAAAAAGPDPVEAVRSGATQQMLLAWIAWRTTLAGQPGDAEQAEPPPATPAATFHHDIERRLRRWHERIVADWKGFDALADSGLHALRKRIKRQRYAVEFFAPVLRRRKVERYLAALTTIQDRMGELNDLFVARARYQSLAESDPAALFALGWLAARIANVRALAKPALGQLARAKAPAS